MGVVLNETNIDGADIVRPCQMVDYPDTYAGALQCQAMCDGNAKCMAWTFHRNAHEAKMRCCVKHASNRGCRHAVGMWSGLKKKKPLDDDAAVAAAAAAAAAAVSLTPGSPVGI